VDVLFLDANVLFSAAYKEDSRLRRLWDLEDVELVTSAYALEEARRNLTSDDRKQRLERLLSSLRIVPEIAHPGKIGELALRDLGLPDDDLPILLSAIEARASHLITGDFRDFGKLFGREIATVRILPPVEYLRSRSA
jgi:predicted nucleic acid-binding protein